MRATTGTSAQRSTASANPIGRPIRMPVSDSVTVTTAPWRMARTSPPVITDQPCRILELRFKRHRQIREILAEPLLLQLGKPAVLLLLGDKAVQEFQQLRVALGYRPGRKRFS